MFRAGRQLLTAVQHGVNYTPGVGWRNVAPRHPPTCCFVTILSSAWPQCPGAYQFKRANVAVSRCHRVYLRTTPRRDVHPLLWVFLKPLTQVGIIISGRRVRKWWKSTPLAERSRLKTFIRESRHILASLVLIVGTLFCVYYVTHLQEAPITGRRRFVILTPHQIQSIAAAESQMLISTLKSKLVPSDNRAHQVVLSVVKHIVQANSDLSLIRDTDWRVVLVHDDSVSNAMVLPTGDIFVFTGLFKVVRNVDQLSIVLAHELSHVLLGHSAEQLSFAQLLDFIVIAVMAALWILIPSDGIAFVTQWFYTKVLEIGANLPYNRFLEKEADEVGLILAAKACFDVRQGPAFWQAMDELARAGDDLQVPALLSTHPTHDSRVENLSDMLPKALKMRQLCGCPELPSHKMGDQWQK